MAGKREGAVSGESSVRNSGHACFAWHTCMSVLGPGTVVHCVVSWLGKAAAKAIPKIRVKEEGILIKKAKITMAEAIVYCDCDSQSHRAIPQSILIGKPSGLESESFSILRYPQTLKWIIGSHPPMTRKWECVFKCELYTGTNLF